MTSRPIIRNAICALLAALCCVGSLHAAAPFKSGDTVKAQQWQTADLTLEGPENLGAPFETEATAVFTGPAGAKPSWTT